MKIKTKDDKRVRIHLRQRKRITGTKERPRLSVFRSNTRLVAQLIDDNTGVTIANASSADEKAKTPRERAEKAASTLAKRAQEKGIKSVVFDRGGFRYLGTVKAFADAARAAGLLF